MSDFEMTPPVRMAAHRHAREAFAQGHESCGLIVVGTDGEHAYVPCENTHPEKGTGDAFRIDPAMVEPYYEAKTLVAIVHSHPHGPAAPTKADMIGQRQSGVPWVIVVFDEGEIVDDFSFPASLDAPLKGRMFRPGVDDCLTAIRRWHWQHDGFLIPDFPRDPNWWLNEEGNGPGEDNMYLDFYEQAGFRVLAPEEVRADPDDPRSPLLLQPGDVGLAKVLSPWRINHGVIYTGGQLMLHHLLQRASAEEPITRWLPKLEIWIRRRDLGVSHENNPPLRKSGD